MICKPMLMLLLCFWITAAQQPRRQLVYVQAVWRHGDRAPAKLPYPNDANDESKWPRGWAQITNLGMKQTYELGQFIRLKYGDMMGAIHKVDELTVTSTAIERAIVSAQGVLRGLYPASGQAQWMSGENWQPTSFASRSRDEPDLMLHQTKEKCPPYHNLIEKERKEQYKKIDAEYNDIFTRLSSLTGHSPFAAKEACRTAALRFEINHQLPQPAWVNQKWPTHDNKPAIDILKKIKWETRFNEFNTELKSKFSAGILAGDFLAKVEAVAAGQAIVPSRFNFFSAHDGTIIPLLVALRISNGLHVPLASCVFMEVYTTTVANNAKKVEVKFLYRNETDPVAGKNAYTLIVKGCTEYCPHDKLKTLIAPNTFATPDDFRQACSATANLRP